jgi:spore protease
VVIGVPTVVDALSIASELSDSLFSKIDVEFSKYHSKKEELLSEMVENDLNLMVTPKEVDSMIGRISKVISNGINLALHKDIDLEYIESFTF